MADTLVDALRYPLLVALLTLIKSEKVNLFFHLDNKVSFILLSTYSVKVTHYLKIGALGNAWLSNFYFMLFQALRSRIRMHEASSGIINPYNCTRTTILGTFYYWTTLWPLVLGSQMWQICNWGDAPWIRAVIDTISTLLF